MPLDLSNPPKELYGLDRRGELLSTAVTCFPGTKAQKNIFIATETLCGRFAAESMLLTAEGQFVAAMSVATNNLISDLRFETMLALPGMLAREEVPAEEIWCSLRQSAAFSDDRCAVVRCRGERGESFPKKVTGWGLLNKYGNTTILAVNHEKFLEALTYNLTDSIEQLAKYWLEDSEGIFELEVREIKLAIWLMSSLQKKNIAYRIYCDTRQHTDLIRIERVTHAMPVIGRGISAFCSVSTKVPVVIEWRAKTWNPLANGFILTAN